jgi:hypothetical protein
VQMKVSQQHPADVLGNYVRTALLVRTYDS